MAKRPDSGSDPAHQDETRGIGTDDETFEKFDDADDESEEDEDNDEEENEGGF
ncbi:MAG: hypothetical protein ABIS06_15435 [Vicinamibacterales bacterium]